MNTFETEEKINERIANNLTYYRKAAGYTQAELARKINYSDKSVSKWELANGVPDVYILLKLAELYGVSVDDLTGNKDEKKKPIPKESAWVRPLVALLSSGLVWLVATIVFVMCTFFHPTGYWWLTFLYALPVNAILLVVFSAVWKKKFLNFTSVSVLIWSVLTCTYLTSYLTVKHFSSSDARSLWLIFMLGVPLEVLAVCWFFFGKVKRKATKKNDSSNG